MTDHATPITVWIVEDDPSYRAATASLLDSTADLRCIGAFGRAAEAIEHAGVDPAPTVLLLDVNLPGSTGVEALPEIRAALPDTRVVMHTVRDDADTIFRALERGASGYVVKGSSTSVLLQAISEAASGGMLLPPTIARRVQSYFTASRGSDYHLTPREQAVLRLMCEGLSLKMIADRLSLSRATVSVHVQHLYDKLHVNSNTGAVAKALKERLV